MQPDSSSHFFTCEYCQAYYEIVGLEVPRFCAVCGKAPSQIHQPSQPSSPSFIGRYKILESIGKGGMGEVFLAYDPSCERRLALKRIRPDLIQHPQIQRRFFKEAKMTCQLTHPAIIPIYTIHKEETQSYYTMPFVEGETLKQMIRKARKHEKQEKKLDQSRDSIPSLMRIFMIICQAVAYAHSRGTLHRDLKLENIIVGKYGEVLILDWGLAKYIHSAVEEDRMEQEPTSPPRSMDITRAGKVVGTIAYMAPERALGHPSTIQTDIYSLGVILYQMLTLHPPFKRGKQLEDFLKTLPHETFTDPIVAAPYRHVPRLLSRVTEKCLQADPSKRYQTVDELIHDLEIYLEGRSEWFAVAQLDITRKEDWEFQENILIAEHTAITRITEEAEWVILMVSRQSFTGNTKIETEVCLGEKGHGIGFLLSVPEASERKHINDGYCLWLGSDITRSTKLLRSSVEVIEAPDIFLKRHHWYRIRIEKIEETIHVYINNALQFSYISHLPLIGTHIALLARDADFAIHPLQVYVGSLNIMVNCLAVPDAFLAHQDFNQALSQYRRIAYSFPDRIEGREALFRAGSTLIEQAKKSSETSEKQRLLDEALKEFEQLHRTPGAPLEYLGKALVYQTLSEYLEEVKCFELAYRRYTKHPLLPVLQEHILLRMHELSRTHRIATYHFILLAARHFPLNAIDTHTRRLFASLQKHWEHLAFIEENPSRDKTHHQFHFAIQVAFWLDKPYVLGEVLNDLIDKAPSWVEMGNALFCLIELGAWRYAKEKLKGIHATHPQFREHVISLSIEQAIACEEMALEDAIHFLLPLPLEHANFHWLRALFYYLDRALAQHRTDLVYTIAQYFEKLPLTSEEQLHLNVYKIWTYLLDKDWQAAGEILHEYSLEFLSKESTPLYFLYGCWLQAIEGKEMAFIHFAGVLNVLYPRSWTLACHYLIGELPEEGTWFQQAFLWEKRQLYRQLALYFHCVGDIEKTNYFETLYRQQFHVTD